MTGDAAHRHAGDLSSKEPERKERLYSPARETPDGNRKAELPSAGWLYWARVPSATMRRTLKTDA